MQIRINKYLSLCGVGSRRKIEEDLWQSRYRVNGRTAIPGEMLDTDKDVVTNQRDEILKPFEEFLYIALNKPLGTVSTTDDELGRKTIMDIVQTDQRLYPIGRLDKNSTGLILLTNDGDLALKLTHPRYHLPKVYEVTTNQDVTDKQIEELSKGVEIGYDKTMPAEVKRLADKAFKITLHQGMKRQIREMCKAVGLTVNTLHRISIGPIKLGGLKSGEYRELSEQEKSLIL